MPGAGPDPRTNGTWVDPGDELRFAYACDLFEAGMFWEAHELWEERWRGLPEATVAARHQQGLLLVAACLHKARVGRLDGAEQLLGQARRVFRGVCARRGEVVGGLDVPALLEAVEQGMYGGPRPVLGAVVPLEPRVVVEDDDDGPRWPPWVEDWVLPYVTEPALWPVLLALLGHVVVVIAPLVLAVARTGSLYAVAGLVVLAAVSAVFVRWELRVRGRPSAVTGAVVGTWIVSLVSAWGADRLGVL